MGFARQMRFETISQCLVNQSVTVREEEDALRRMRTKKPITLLTSSY